MGSQGALPSHRELLGLPELKLMHEDHWSIKALFERNGDECDLQARLEDR